MTRDYERTLKNKRIIKYSLLIFLLLIIIFIVLRWYYLTIQNPLRIEVKEAVARAYDETSLKEVTDTETFIGDESYTIIYGKDKEDQEIIIWIGETEVHTELASEGVSKEAVERLILNTKTDIELLRITPAKWTDEWVWEVFYKRDEEKGTRHYYDFYRFADGEWLETYTMSIMR
ncbi:cell wall elongation regulator TseB-like domain-containing protein [Chengkuizengella axinellae]|uniref:DUF5590 domain-containing protein n=1 Tax=Chengkuizengella axinellae TaxID=3064388 RepID=A0ABT9IWV0_9BACL|nr:DUF5590 domain-containing protein [Chengkuizengella sp. 2205SS18-9]MDP5273844.1 DUF5590 domain-containing protein [Chengkuizengella sp. 2205SS18-9]